MDTSKKIKICYIINDLLPGGAQKVVVDTARSLDKNRFDVCVLVLRDVFGIKRGYSDLSAHLESAGIRIVNLNLGNKIRFQGISRIMAHLRTEKPDILHAHLPMSILLAALAGRIAGVRTIIAHEHNTYHLSPWKLRIARKLISPFISLTVCYTDIVEKEIFGCVHVASADTHFKNLRSCTIFNGVDGKKVQEVQSRFSLPDKRHEKRTSLGIQDHEILVTAVGRLIGWKGHENLIRSAQEIIEKNPAVKILIVGYGPDHNALQALITQFGVSDNVFMLGQRMDVYEILAVSDIFSSVYAYDDSVRTQEALGIAGLEGMAFGIPTIAALYASTPRFITSGKTGVVVPPKNPHALAEAILTLANNKKMRTDIGKAGAEYIKNRFSWDYLISLYEKMYIMVAR